MPRGVPSGEDGVSRLSARCKGPFMADPKGPLLRFETPNYIMRSLQEGDENETWTGWLADPQTAAMLNAQPVRATLKDLRGYIARFDRVTRLLFGIFEKATGRMVGVRTCEIDKARSAYRVHLLIGVPEDRGQGARTETAKVVNHWMYEECGLLHCEATVVSSNERMLKSLLQSGWIVTGHSLKKSAAGNAAVQLVEMRRHREIWRRLQRQAASE